MFEHTNEKKKMFEVMPDISLVLYFNNFIQVPNYLFQLLKNKIKYL